MNRDTLTNLVKFFLGQLVFMVQPHAVPVNVASEKAIQPTVSWVRVLECSV